MFGSNYTERTSELFIILIVGGYVMLNGLLALVSLVLTAVSFYEYTASKDVKLYFYAAIVFLVLTLIFGGLFLSGRMNKTEDIHITE